MKDKEITFKNVSAKKTFFTLAVLFLSFLNSYAQRTRPHSEVHYTGYKEAFTITDLFEQKAFIENNGGQFNNDIDTKNLPVLFSTRIEGVALYFTANGIIYRYDEFPNLTEEQREKIEHAKEKGKTIDVPSVKTHFFSVSWKNANPNTNVTPQNEQPFYFTYPKGDNQTIYAKAYNKLLYTNIYPGIDIEYHFPQDKKGIEYNIIVHPGGDLADVKLLYNDCAKMELSVAGDLELKSAFGKFIDHAPANTYYEDNNEKISCNFILNKETREISFNAGSYDHHRTLVIDPWTQNPGFTGYNSAYDVNYDANGDVYVCGSYQPFQLSKYNSAGALQWTYNATQYNNTGSILQSPCYGGFAVDYNTGRSYWGEGYNSNGARVLKLSNAGALLTTYAGNSNFNEIWRVRYNRCLSSGNQIIIAGGTSVGANQAAVVDTSLVTLTPKNVLAGATQSYHDMVGIAIDNTNGACYMATATTTGSETGYDNKLLSLPIPALTPANYMTADGYAYGEVGSVTYVDNAVGSTNAMNCMAASPDWVYMYDGKKVTRFNKATGSSAGSTNVGASSFNWGGIDVDQCNHLYLGNNTNITMLDSSFNNTGTIAAAGQVYDVKLGMNGALYACGKGFVSTYTTSVVNITLTTTQTPATCSACDGTATVKVNNCGHVAPAANYSYLWNNGQTTQTATGLCPGTYSVTVSSYCYQTYTASITVTTNPGSFTVTTNNPSYCTGGSAALTATATGAVSYTWTPATGLSGTNSASVTASPTATTVYTVSTTNGSGCVATATATVTVNPLPNAGATAGAQITCTTNTSTVNGSSVTAGVTYSWTGGGIVSGANTSTATVNAAGVYTVTVTNPVTTCSSVATTTITANTTVPNASASSGPQLTCTTNTTTVNGSSTTAGATFSWSGPGIVSGGNAATATVNATGTYTLTVTNPANGCTSTATTTVTSNGSIPNASATAGPQITCVNSTSTLNGSSTTPGVTYSWTGTGITSGANTATATVNAAGVYTITVTDPSSGCTSISTTTINASTTAPNVSGSAGPQITCLSNTTTVNGSSTTAGATYSWTGAGITSGANTATATVNAAGTYSLTVTDPANGCTSSTSVAVTSSSTNPNIGTSAGAQLSCITNSSSVNGSSTTPGVTYSWTGPGITSGANTSTATVNAAGTYTLTVTDPANGCTSVSTVTVTSNTTVPNVTASSGPQINCATNTSTVGSSSSSAGVTFSWAGAGIISGANTATATVNAAGVYTVTVTDPANGCTATGTATITATSTVPNSSASAGAPLTCITSSTTANGSSSTAGVTYAWSGPGIISGANTATATVNASGVYTLTVTDPSSGCSNIATTTITANTIPPNASATGGAPLTCTTNSTNVNGSSTTLGATYSWNGPGITAGGNSSIATVNTIGTYTVTVTDPQNGCTNTATVTIASNTTPPNASASAGPQITCTSATTTVNGSSTTAGASFSWSGPGIVSGGNSITATVNSTGTYTVTVTDPNNGCTSTAVATISSSGGVPTVSATPGNAITCVTNTSSVNGSSTTPGVSYSWSGAGIISGANTPTATVNSPGVYTLTVTDPGNGCSSSTTTSIITNTTAPNASASSGQPITCSTNTSNVTAASTTNGVSFSWSGSGITSGSNLAIATVNAAATYTVTVTDPANGCTNTATATITSNTVQPNVSASGNQVTCNTSTTTVNASSTTAGVAYSWSGAGIVGGGSNASATVNAAGTYTVTVTDPSNGCSNTATAVVTPNSNVPNISVAAGSQIPCASSVTTVNASSTTSGVTYGWTGAGIVTGAGTANATVNAAGNYTVTVTDPSNGCTATAVENVTVASTPTVVIGPLITSGCSPVCVNFTNSAPAQGTYSWTFGDGASGNTLTPMHCFITQGTYTVGFTYTDVNGCKGSSSANVVVYPVPHAGFYSSPQPATILDPNIQFTDASYSSIISWQWNFGDNGTSLVQNPSHLYADTGSYPVQLIVTSIAGCKDSVTTLVHINPEYMLYVPNAFSPNGDDLNEVFEAKGEGIKDFKLYIFDRWGEMIFYSDNIAKGWDGKRLSKGGDIVQEDVYVWKIELKTYKNEPHQLSGHVNLIK